MKNVPVAEIRKMLIEKEQEAMEELAGKRVLGFLLSIRVQTTSCKGKKYLYPVIYADKSISRQRCLLRLGKVCSLKEAEQVILRLMKNRVQKDSSQKKFLANIAIS